VASLTSEGSLVRTQLRPLPGQRVAGEQRRGLAAGEHSLPGECSRAGLGGIRAGQRRFRADLCRLGAGHWERKSELVSGKTPGSGGALQVFGLVIGVARGTALGAQLGALVGALVGAQSGRALSHGLLKRQSLVSGRDCRPGLASPGSWSIRLFVLTALCSRRVGRRSRSGDRAPLPEGRAGARRGMLFAH
jgi:hypothetical protein